MVKTLLQLGQTVFKGIKKSVSTVKFKKKVLLTGQGHFEDCRSGRPLETITSTAGNKEQSSLPS